MHLSDTTQWIQFIGRILFSLMFLKSGFAHITKAKALGEYAKYKKVPMPVFSTIVTGIMLLAGAAGIILGVWIDLAFLLIALFLIPTSFIMHNYWTVEDPTAKQGEEGSFMKNMTLAFAAIVLLALTSALGSELGYTLTGPLFNL